MRFISTNIKGPAGQLEALIEANDSNVIENLKKGIVDSKITMLAVVCHPHPLHGGTFDNKVVTTLCRAFNSINAITVRFNFRGVGQSEGIYDDGNGEQSDLISIIKLVCDQYNLHHLPLTLAGFSFGAYVASKVAEEMVNTKQNLSHLVLVGTPVSRWLVPCAFHKTLVIHGSADEIITIEDAMKWANCHHLPIRIIEGASHFFHEKLPHLKSQVIDYFQ